MIRLHLLVNRNNRRLFSEYDELMPANGSGLSAEKQQTIIFDKARYLIEALTESFIRHIRHAMIERVHTYDRIKSLVMKRSTITISTHKTKTRMM